MIDLIDCKDKKRHYDCTIKACYELCMANIECLLKIALADSDEHISKLGGESHLLTLMNGYLQLANDLRMMGLIVIKDTEDDGYVERE